MRGARRDGAGGIGDGGRGHAPAGRERACGYPARHLAACQPVRQPAYRPVRRASRPWSRLWHDALWYVVWTFMGLALGVVIIAEFALVTVVGPMMARRCQMGYAEWPSASLASAVAVSAEVVPAGAPVKESPAADAGIDDASETDGADGALPPVDWGAAMSEEGRRNLEALRADIESMEPAPAANLMAWHTLPYPVVDLTRWDDRFEEFSYLLAGTYDAEPELSVFTDGQGMGEVVVAWAKYHLYEADKSDAAQNMAEYQAVVEAADAMDARICEKLEEPEARWQVEAGECSQDAMYVALLYWALTGSTTYSDDVDDTCHANDIYGALVEGESKCYGVACAAKAVLNRRGIPALIATGSVNHDEDRRHAWVVLWVDGGWRTLDITHGQGQAPPNGMDASEWVDGGYGYWGGCMVGYGDYVQSSGMDVDPICEDVMRAYEEQIGVHTGTV